MASIQYVVSATDAASAVFAKIGLSADHLDSQLQDLSKRVATPEIDLKDAKFTAGLIRAAERIDKLSAMVADPSVEVDTRKAQAEIFRITAMLDRLDAKRVNVSVDVDRSLLSRLGGLFGGGGGGGASGPTGLGTGLAGLGNAGPYAIGGGAALAAALAPALLPVGIGGLAGLGAVGGGLFGASQGKKILTADLANIKQITTALKTAIGQQKQQLSQSLQDANKQYAKDSAFYAPFTALQAAIQGLAQNFLAPLRPVMGPLTQIIKEFGKGLAALGPTFTALFQASLPFIRMFAGLLLQTGKILLPVFTQSLKQMTPFLPQITKGLLSIVQGLAGMIKAMGPGGMKASAEIFVALCKVMEIALIVLGHTATFLAERIVQVAHNMRKTWDTLRHDTAVIFDGMRHDIAHIWDVIFSNTIGRVQRGGHDIEREWNTWTHNVGVIFDAFRHATAQVWDTIWNNTVGRVKTGISDVIGWFKTLPGRAVNALFGFGHSLYAFAHSALTEFLNGLKAVGGTVLGWLRNFIGGIPHAIMSFLGMSPPHAGSVFFDLGANIMRHFEAGIKATAHHVVNAATVTAHRVGAAGAGVQRWAGLVRQALAMEGLSQSLAGNVLFQMQTESGGNPNAINNWDSNAAAGDPSRGLLQTIGSTFSAYHWPGTSWNIYDPLANIAAAINYARHRYGPTLMSGGMGMGSGHGYAAGSWSVPYTGPAVVHQGEMIIPAAAAAVVRSGAGGGNTYNINVTAGVGSNPKEIGRQIVGYIRSFEQGSGAGWRR